MMPTIGYGEDGLTFHALHNGRRALLDRLGDTGTELKDCLVYFRPSFGRAGGDASPQFGEFDAILCTTGSVYLIESKWNSGGQFQPAVNLSSVQITRHRIFAWLYETWGALFANGAPPDWPLFVQNHGHAFTQAFPHRPLAPDGSLLARNLQTILANITQPQQPKRRLRNVLLYFSPQAPGQVVYPAGEPAPQPPFDLVTLHHNFIGVSHYFDMPDSVNVPV
jgi:hypothetical protein